MMNRINVLIFAVIFAVSIAIPDSGFAQKTKGKKSTEAGNSASDGALSKADSLSYGLGMSIGGNLKQQPIEGFNGEVFKKGVMDAYQGNPTLMTEEESTTLISNYFTAKQLEAKKANLEKGMAFLEENKKQAGVKVLESGLQYKVLKEGTGPKPTDTDKVTTHYHGTLIDGTVFDSSVERGQPATFPVNGVIKGWTEALQLMRVGAKWQLFIAPDLAYGERGAGGAIGPNATLIFEVELLEIQSDQE